MTRTAVLDNLRRLQDFLKIHGRTFFEPTGVSEYLEKTSELINRYEDPGEILYVGILGGTGVGKSTLINALAGAEISGYSDRRPYTDRAVVYRHQDTPRGLEGLNPLIKPDDAVHSIESLRNLVLLDLPDFDAFDQKNRETALQIIPTLDAIIWVVSPEKYADAAFYDFAKRINISSDNFSFVLNKADELIIADSPEDHSKLNEVVGDFIIRLHQWAGVTDPRIFYISAMLEFTGARTFPILNDEFNNLRGFLSTRRDAKEIAGIKTKNLLIKAADLINDVKSAVDVNDKLSIVKKLKPALIDSASPSQLSDIAIAASKESLAACIASDLLARENSIGPVRAGLSFLQRFKSFSYAGNFSNPVDQIGAIAVKLAEASGLIHNNVMSKVDTELTYYGITQTGRHTDPNSIVDSIINKVSGKIEANIRFAAASSLRIRLRRAYQWFWVILPVIFLLIRLSGVSLNDDWSGVSFSGFIKAALHVATTLFGTEGLIGVTALVIWLVIIVLILAARRLRRINAVADRIADMATDALARSISLSVEEFFENKRKLLEKIEAGMTLLNNVNLDEKQSQKSRRPQL